MHACNTKRLSGILLLHYLLPAFCDVFVSQAEFIEKDNDALHSDLEELIRDSKDAFLKSLFPGVAPKKNDIGSMSFGNAINRVGSKKLGFISVGNKFRVSLDTPQFELFSSVSDVQGRLKRKQIFGLDLRASSNYRMYDVLARKSFSLAPKFSSLALNST